MADQSQPGKKPRGEQLGEISPAETLGLGSTPRLAGLVSEPYRLYGARGVTFVVDPTSRTWIIPEIFQTLRKIGPRQDKRSKEQQEQNGLRVHVAGGRKGGRGVGLDKGHPGYLSEDAGRGDSHASVNQNP